MSYILRQNNKTVQRFEITDHIYLLCKDFIDLNRSVTNSFDIVIDITEHETIIVDHYIIPSNIGELLSKINPYIMEGIVQQSTADNTNLFKQLGVKQIVVTSKYMNSLKGYTCLNNALTITNTNNIIIPIGISDVLIYNCNELTDLNIRTTNNVRILDCNSLINLTIDSYGYVSIFTCTSLVNINITTKNKVRIFECINLTSLLVNTCDSVYINNCTMTELHINTNSDVYIGNCPVITRLVLTEVKDFIIHNCASLNSLDINSIGKVYVTNCTSLTKTHINAINDIHIKYCKVLICLNINTNNYVELHDNDILAEYTLNDQVITE